MILKKKVARKRPQGGSGRIRAPNRSRDTLVVTGGVTFAAMCYESEAPGTPLCHAARATPPSNSSLSGFAWLARQLQLAVAGSQCELP